MNLPALAASQGIATREQFHAAVALVNQLTKRDNVGVDETKATLTKAEALRAWASFDKRLTVDEKKAANCAMTRTVRMCAQVARREQPSSNSRNSHPGGVTWLMRELQWSRNRASLALRLLNDEIYHAILDSARHWNTAIQGKGVTGNRGRSLLNRMVSLTNITNTARASQNIEAKHIPARLSQLRKIRAWCEAYEAALMQRQSREKSGRT